MEIAISPYEKILSGKLSKEDMEAHFNPTIAGQAVASALVKLQAKLKWSNSHTSSVLNIPRETLRGWLESGSIPIRGLKLSANVERIINLLAIHQNLEAMFNNPKNELAWLNTPHSELNHKKPIELMGQSTEGLVIVRQYLEFVNERGA